MRRPLVVLLATSMLLVSAPLLGIGIASATVTAPTVTQAQNPIAPGQSTTLTLKFTGGSGSHYWISNSNLQTALGAATVPLGVTFGTVSPSSSCQNSSGSNVATFTVPVSTTSSTPVGNLTFTITSLTSWNNQHLLDVRWWDVNGRRAVYERRVPVCGGSFISRRNPPTEPWASL